MQHIYKRVLFYREIYAISRSRFLGRNRIQSLSLNRTEAYSSLLSSMERRGEWMSLRRRRHTMLLLLRALIHLLARIGAREAVARA